MTGVQTCALPILGPDEKFLRCGGDTAWMLPMIEMAGNNHSKWLKEINYIYNQFSFGGQTFISSSTTDVAIGDGCNSSNPACRKNAGYSVSNLNGSYKYDKNWTLRLNLENIFNKTYQQAYGFNTPGFGAFLTIQYQP